jgi:DNA-binding protein H-NS
MKPDMLDALGDDELRAIGARCDVLLKQHDTERKEKAIAKAAVDLAAVGISLKDLAKAKFQKKGNVKGPTYHAGHQYQHPTNKALTWNAKGQKPNWLRELENGGGKAVECA